MDGLLNTDPGAWRHKLTKKMCKVTQKRFKTTAKRQHQKTSDH